MKYYMRIANCSFFIVQTLSFIYTCVVISSAVPVRCYNKDIQSVSQSVIMISVNVGSITTVYDSKSIVE